MTESDRHDTPTGDRRISEGAGASPDESNPTDFAPEEFTPAYTPPLARSGTERPSFGRPAADNKELQERVDNLTARNAKLLDTLKDARQQLVALREEVDRLGQPPSGYGVLLEVQPDATVDVFTSGRKMRLTCSPNIDTETLHKGQTLRLNEALTIVEACEFDTVGEISTLREVLGDGKRALVVGHADEERVVHLAEPLLGEVDGEDGKRRRLRPGDSLLIDTKAGFAFERVPKA